MSMSSPVKQVPGDTPDCEIQLIPSWIVFSAEDSYRTAQYASFKVKHATKY